MNTESSIFSYNRNRKTFSLSFINNWIDSTNTYENILDKNIYMSCRRHMTGTITPQSTDATQETNLNYQLDKIRFDLDDVH